MSDAFSSGAPRSLGVDVILPTHSRPHTIEYSIRSALAQTHSDFTLHVIGDGCDPQTERIVESFGDARVRFRRFPKGYGFGYAHRNVVLQESDAPFVAYLTDDDLWFPDHLEHALARLQEEALDLLAFRSAHVQYPDFLDPHFFAYDWSARGPSWVRNWFTGAVGCVHRRALFEVIGVWDDRLFRFGDRDFYNRARMSRARTRFENRVSLLRFFALHWDKRYAAFGEPPQKRYLPRVLDERWREELRGAAAPGPRSMATRRRQLKDFVAFAVQSGPKFARFLWQRHVASKEPRL